jgi:hypothetical protein
MNIWDQSTNVKSGAPISSTTPRDSFCFEDDRLSYVLEEKTRGLKWFLSIASFEDDFDEPLEDSFIENPITLEQQIYINMVFFNSRSLSFW